MLHFLSALVPKNFASSNFEIFLNSKNSYAFFIPTEMKPHVFHQTPKTLLHKVVFCVKRVLFGVQTVKIRGFLPDYLSKYYT
jgi:hypothetical protein